MKFKSAMAGAAAALAISAGAATAATVVDLGGSAGTAWSYTYAVGGSNNVTVTGERRDGVCGLFCSFFQPERVSRASDGLGVDGGPLDSGELDGQVDERLTFTFDFAVRFLSVLFNDIDDNDPYDIYVDTGSGLQLVTGDAEDNPYVFNPSLVGNTLQIAVDGNASAFRVKSLEVAAVPLPAAGWLMLAGLGGLAALRRKRRAA